jgi:lipoate-protein ligase B
LENGAAKVPCQILNVGMTPYEDALRLQLRLQLDRAAGVGKDTILLLEHPPVVSLGKCGSRQDILVSDEVLDERGIPIVRTDRGGATAFYNPGQLVVCVVLSLAGLNISISRFVRQLEEVVIRVLADFGITGQTRYEYPGVWVADDNICSLGLSVSDRISMHGLALNVNNSLDYLSYMNPCGIWGKGVTTMARVLRTDITVEQVTPSVIKHFSSIFALDIDYRLGCTDTVPD